MGLIHESHSKPFLKIAQIIFTSVTSDPFRIPALNEALQTSIGPVRSDISTPGAEFRHEVQPNRYYLHRSAHQTVVCIYEYSFMLIKFLRSNCLIKGVSPRIVRLGSQPGMGVLLRSLADFFYPMFLRARGIKQRGSVTLLS